MNGSGRIVLNRTMIAETPTGNAMSSGMSDASMAGALQGTPDAPVQWSWLQREHVREVALRAPVGYAPA